MMDAEQFFEQAKKNKEQAKQENEKRMSDRIRYGAKETLNYFQRKLNQGYTSKEILEDLNKSKYK
ncbi:MAG: hypothetical protein ACPL1B_09140 [Thermoprotei archaeon]